MRRAARLASAGATKRGKGKTLEFARITLYHYPATRSVRVKWLLHELFDEAFETELVRLYDGEQYSSEFLAMNPGHAVPTLRLCTRDGAETTMAESGAIIVLLADVQPETGLAPPPAPFSIERADYLKMIHFCGAAIDMMLWQIRVHRHILPREKRDEATVARYHAKFAAEVEPLLRRRLETTPHICGNAFSAVDCMYGHAVMWARSYGLCADPIFRAYLSRVSKRPAFVKAFADAKDFQPEVPADASMHAHFAG